MENPTQSFKEMTLVLQLVLVRSKTDELELAKEKGGFFCTEYFVRREIFSFCALARVLNTLQNIHIFTCHQTLLHALLLLAFKIIERLQCILN